MRKETEFLVRADKEIMQELERQASTLGISKAELIRKSIYLMFDFLRDYREELNKKVLASRKPDELINIGDLTMTYQEEMKKILDEIVSKEDHSIKKSPLKKYKRINAMLEHI